MAFCHFLGEATTTLAELMAVLKGLELCCASYLDFIWFEVDSQIVSQLLNRKPPLFWAFQDIVFKIHQLLNTRTIKISHIVRVGNMVADCLANLAIEKHISKNFGELETHLSPDISQD